MSILSQFLWLDVLAIASLIGIYYYLTKNFNYWEKRSVLYLKPLPLFGSILPMLIFQKSVGQFMEDLYIVSRQMNAGFIGFWVGREPCLFVSDPDLIKKVLVKDFSHFDDRVVNNKSKNDPLGCLSVFGLKKPHWKGMRTRLSQMFTEAKRRQLSSLLLRNAENAIKYIDEHNQATGNKPLDAKDVCGRYAVDNIIGFSLGLAGQCLQDTPKNQKMTKSESDNEIPQYNVMAKSITGISIHRAWETSSMFLFPEINNWFGFSLFSNKVSEFMRNLFWSAANLKRKEMSLGNGTADLAKAEPGKDGDKIKDLLDMLLQMEDSKLEINGLKYSGDTLVAQFGVMFAAGVATSGSAMPLLLSSITRRPEIQDRLRQEIKDTIKKHSGLTYDAINEMTYLDMVLKETLRLYPILPFVDRMCTKTYKMEGTDLVIEKGTKVYISLSGLQTDPRYWEDPETFDPERFSPENKQKIVPYTYIPFGEGPRMCMGFGLGMLQIKLGLARILNCYRVGAALPKDTEGRIPIATRGVVITPLKPVLMSFMPDKYNN